MSNRLYTGAIIVFWLATMSWLVSERILPSFFYGEPPKSGVAYQTEPVAWQLLIDGVPCGYAVLQSIEASGGMRESHSLICFESLPKPKVLPSYFAPIAASLEALSPKIRTRLAFDSMGTMLNFKTWFWFGDEEHPMTLVGAVRGGSLHLKVRAAMLSRDIQYDWPANGLSADELAPESQLQLLYVGRKWRHEVYSPLSPVKQPIEVLEAEVTEEVLCDFNRGQLQAKKVEYRMADQAGVAEQDRLRGVMWVAADGRVIKQETRFMGSLITLLRMSEGESARYAANHLELEKYVASYSASTPETITELDDATAE